MNKVTSLIVGVLATGALIVGVVAYNKTPSVIVGAKGEQGPRGEQGPAGRDGKDGVTKVVTQVVEKPASQTLGAVSTLDGVSNPYVKINNLEIYNYYQPMIATSSVLCSIQNPYNSTSTVLSYTTKVTTNNLGTHLIDISTSTTAFGSSTPAFVKRLSVSGQYSVVWTPNGTTTNTNVIGMRAGATTGISDIILGPTEYITLRISTSTPGTFGSYNVGSCAGQIQKL